MKILVLGGDGMLGHQLLKHLSQNHEVKVTLRQDLDAYNKYNLFNNDNAYTSIDVRRIESIIDVMSEFKPQIIINAVGIVKQRGEAKESIPNIEINALLPHKLAILCKSANVRFVHMSTDCVFSGKSGNYKETDIADAIDLYGKSKFLGEVSYENAITLRTSMIGKELYHHHGLIDWFLAQNKEINGYKNAIYSGFTTQEMSRIIEMLIIKYPDASGIYHLSSMPISKFDLLILMKQKLNLDIKINSYENFYCDRSLDSSRFRQEFNYAPPTWEEMVEELACDIKENN